MKEGIFLIGLVLLVGCTTQANIKDDNYSLNKCETGNSQYHWVKIEVHQDFDVRCWDIVNDTFTEIISCPEENRYDENWIECNIHTYSKSMNHYNFTKCPMDIKKEICKKRVISA